MRPLATGVLILLSLACERSGELVVVLDTTMRGDAVEVVAFRTDDGMATRRNDPTPSEQRREVTTPLDDSVATLSDRFRVVRDSLNREVARLDTMDRRTRGYAVRYAEIRRRTIAAEQLRARRDSMRDRAATSRSSAAAATTTVPPSQPAEVSRPPLDRLPGLQRHAVRDSTVALELGAGRWSVGVARDGRLLGDPAALTIVAGKRDTLRFPRGTTVP